MAAAGPVRLVLAAGRAEADRDRGGGRPVGRGAPGALRAGLPAGQPAASPIAAARKPAERDPARAHLGPQAARARRAGRLALPLLALDARNLGDVELEPGAHRRADRRLLDVFPFGARRLRLDDRVDEGVEILPEVGFGEARLADPGMDD